METDVPLEPRKEPTQARSKATVDALVEATARLLVDEGYEHVSTNRIAEVAGVSVGSLYQYFPNKQSLVMAVIRRHQDQMIAMLQRHVAELADAPVDQAVRTYVRAMFEAHRVHPELQRVLLPLMLQLGLDHLEDVQYRILAMVQAWLNRHRDEILPQRLDAAALVLVTSVESATHASFLDYSRGIDSQALEDEVIDLVLRYLTGESD